LRGADPDAEVTRKTGRVRANLMRMWADV